MLDNRNLEHQESTLTDEELDQVAGGSYQMGVVENPCSGMLDAPVTKLPQEKKPSSPFPQNCG